MEEGQIQCNGLKRRNNGRQNSIYKTKDRATRTQIKSYKPLFAYQGVHVH